MDHDHITQPARLSMTPRSVVRMVVAGTRSLQWKVVMIAATDTGLVPMSITKAVGLFKEGDDYSGFMVLDELDGDRHLVIRVGQEEAFSLAASLQGWQWPRPMTYQFTAALVRGLGGRVREVRLDRIVEGAYASTVEAEGPQGTALVDARASDAPESRRPYRRIGVRRAGCAGRLHRPAGRRFR
jgi:bifunctional DNase/RNase